MENLLIPETSNNNNVTNGFNGILNSLAKGDEGGSFWPVEQNNFRAADATVPSHYLISTRMQRVYIPSQ